MLRGPVCFLNSAIYICTYIPIYNETNDLQPFNLSINNLSFILDTFSLKSQTCLLWQRTKIKANKLAHTVATVAAIIRVIIIMHQSHAWKNITRSIW